MSSSIENLTVLQDIAEGRKIVLKAIEYYKSALNITVELKDVAGMFSLDVFTK